MSTGMMSTIPSGMPGNSGICPSPYARMIGSAILNPSIHPGAGWNSALSMIDGPDDRQRQLLEVGELLHRALAHRLRERVDVGPAERPRARSAVARQPLRHPILAPLLRLLGHRHGAGARVLLRRLVHEVVEHLGATRLRLHVAPGLQRQLALRSPVDPVVERVLRNDPLRDAGDVRGRDVHETWPRTALDHPAVQVHGAEQVGLEPLVDRRVERHGRRGVDRDVDVAGQLRDAAREVPVHDRDAFVQERAQARPRPDVPRSTSNAGLRNRYSTRSRDVDPVCDRTSRTIRPSGTSPRRRSKITCPRKPVTPVSRIVLPVRRSTIEDPLRPRRSLPCGRLWPIYQLVDNPLQGGRRGCRCSR